MKQYTRFFRFPNGFEAKFNSYMEEPEDLEQQSQIAVDFSNKNPKLLELREHLNKLYFTKEDKLDFCNNNFSPIIMNKIFNFIMDE